MTHEGLKTENASVQIIFSFFDEFFQSGTMFENQETLDGAPSNLVAFGNG